MLGRSNLLAPDWLVIHYMRVSFPAMRSAGSHKLCCPYWIIKLSWRQLVSSVPEYFKNLWVPYYKVLYVSLELRGGGTSTCSVRGAWSCIISISKSGFLVSYLPENGEKLLGTESGMC